MFRRAFAFVILSPAQRLKPFFSYSPRVNSAQVHANPFRLKSRLEIGEEISPFYSATKSRSNLKKIGLILWSSAV